MTLALSVAHDLLSRQAEAGEALTQLKLQKLLYYVQGWAFALEGGPRFREAIEAWDYGPVVHALRETYGGHGRLPLPAPDPAVDFREDPLLDAVLEVYAAHEAEQLVALTHLERPWRETYKPFHQRIVIPDVLLRDYFARQAVGEFAIHGQFLDVYRARKHNVVEWRPATVLTAVEVTELEAGLGL